MTQLISLQDLADKTGMTVKFWRNQIAQGNLPGAVKISNRIRVPLDEAIALLEPVTVPA